jgi:ABC-type phosphate/phosphonate transport system substrate-binding protein
MSKKIEQERSVMSSQIESEKVCLEDGLYPNIQLVNRSELPQDVQDAMNAAVISVRPKDKKKKLKVGFFGGISL